MYTMPDGTPAVPAMAIKRCLSDAAHKDLGIEKTMVRKALFFHVDAHGLLPLVDYSEPVMREDLVRVGMGSADLRYRPMFEKWSVDLTMDYDSDLLQIEDIVNLANRAGYGVGLCEWRRRLLRHGMAGAASLGPAWQGMVRPAWAWQARRGGAGSGLWRLGLVRRG
jgi:hypothetical protein